MRLRLLLQVGGFFPVGIFGRDGFDFDPFGDFIRLLDKLLIIEGSLEITASHRHGLQQIVPLGLDHRLALLDARRIVVAATANDWERKGGGRKMLKIVGKWRRVRSREMDKFRNEHLSIFKSPRLKQQRALSHHRKQSNLHRKSPRPSLILPASRIYLHRSSAWVSMPATLSR